MESTTVVLCKRCKKTVPPNELRKEGTLWICNKCYEKAHFASEIQKATLTPPFTQHPTRPTTTKDKHHYVCYGCGYQFHKEHFTPDEVCPYCGDKGNVHRSEARPTN